MCRTKGSRTAAGWLIVSALVLGFACSEDDPALGPSNAPAGPPCPNSPIDSTALYQQPVSSGGDIIAFQVFYLSPQARYNCLRPAATASFYYDRDLAEEHEIQGTRGSDMAVGFVTLADFPYNAEVWQLYRFFNISNAPQLDPGEWVWVVVNFYYYGPNSECDEWRGVYGLCSFIDSLVITEPSR